MDSKTTEQIFKDNVEMKKFFDSLARVKMPIRVGNETTEIECLIPIAVVEALDKYAKDNKIGQYADAGVVAETASAAES